MNISSLFSTTATGALVACGLMSLAPLSDAAPAAAGAVDKAIANAPGPVVVGVPPSDAGRGLVRVGPREIRVYHGGKGALKYLVSRDNGSTWELKDAPASYPPNYGGIPKESPDIGYNPYTKEFLRIQPIGGYVFISKTGIDGPWYGVTKDGKLEKENWAQKTGADLKAEGKLLPVPGGAIFRSPLFLDKGRRVVIPFHYMGSGTRCWISEDGGLTWHTSKGSITSPRHEVKPPHQGTRWFNNAVEATIVELKSGDLWALVRTSQDQAYESFSKDGGETWSPSQPSRFFGTLTMNTLGKLQDGTLVSLWTNTMALPETASSGTGKWEDVFTNRDAHHIALSHDDGKTWYGFREILLDEYRAHNQYATLHGAEDRGKHQSQMIQLDKNRILVSIGQHPEHRKLVIVDLRWVAQTSRSTQTGEHPEEWTTHTFIPVPKGHASYNRKDSCELVPAPGKSRTKVLRIHRLDDPELVNEKAKVDYQNGGATWNFPNGVRGKVTFRFRVAPGEQADDSGLQVSLTDRLFNACDTTTKQYALFTFPIRLKPEPCLEIGSAKVPFTANAWHDITVLWKEKKAAVQLDGKTVGTLPQVNESPNGVSYIHFISTGTKPDAGVLLDTVEANVIPGAKMPKTREKK